MATHALHHVGIIDGPEAREEGVHDVEVTAQQLHKRLGDPVAHEAVGRGQEPAQRYTGQLDYLSVIRRVRASRRPAGKAGCWASCLEQLVVGGEPEVTVSPRHTFPEEVAVQAITVQSVTRLRGNCEQHPIELVT